MSKTAFGAPDRSYGATWQNNQDLAKNDQHQEEFQEMNDNVKRNTYQINNNTAALERILKQISSGKKRVPQEKIHHIQQETNRLAIDFCSFCVTA